MEENRSKRSREKNWGTTSSGKREDPCAGGSGDAAQDSEEEFESLGVEDHQTLLQHLNIQLPEGALNPEISQRATRPDVIKDSKEIVQGLRTGQLMVVEKPCLMCVKVKQASQLRQKDKITGFVQLLFFKKRSKASEKTLKEHWEKNAPKSGCRFRMRDTFFTETPDFSPRKFARSSEAWKASFGNPAENKSNEEDCFKFFLQQKGLELEKIKYQRELKVKSGFFSGRVDYLIEVKSSAEDTETSPRQKIIVECKGTKGNMVGNVFSLSPEGDKAEFNTHHEYYHQTQAYLYIQRKEVNPPPVTAFMVVKVIEKDTQPKFHWTESRLLKIGDGLPLILPPKSGGYWMDPALDRHVETSPTSCSPSFGLETYDIMERDNEAKIYQEFFRHRGSVFREFLLTKLINAEISCYRAERFSKLELRTRSSLLEALRSELSSRSQCMIGNSAPPISTVAPPPEGGGGFIENFKRAIRVRSHSFDTLGVVKKTGGQKQRVHDLLHDQTPDPPHDLPHT
ncbi:Rap1 GTPase-activating protein 2 [Bagarius yarrelli]|uniref:Rap1 GTPase-activating protein 2 n=1 Tax=Bagarius yarrelli TaxID=175774 RepID=A0A556TUQ0_BAGYA|nr:Rap1 GTPase-activating protein 2 [Bagarius yarrelli]